MYLCMYLFLYNFHVYSCIIALFLSMFKQIFIVSFLMFYSALKYQLIRSARCSSRTSLTPNGAGLFWRAGRACWPLDTFSKMVKMTSRLSCSTDAMFLFG